MKFFLDHDVPTEVGRVLRQEGHEVIELRQVLPVQASDFEAFGYARDHDLFLITCNRDDFLPLAAEHSNPGMIVLVRRRSRHAECGHLLAFTNTCGFVTCARKWRLVLNTRAENVALPTTRSNSTCCAASSWRALLSRASESGLRGNINFA